MPKSRKRKIKKNKVNIGIKTNSSIKKPFYGSAPNPIKMKYFEVSMDGLPNLSFEERLNTIKLIGKEAFDRFPTKYQSIKDWFEKYDSAKILSFSYYYFMMANAGYDEEAVTGKLTFPAYYQELLQAFSLTVPRSYKPDPFSEEVYKFKEDLSSALDLFKKSQYNIPDSVKAEEDVHKYILRSEMVLNTTAVRNWSYDHQMKKVTLDLADLIKADFFKVYGYYPSVLLNLLYKMVEEVEVKVNEHFNKIRKIVTQKTYNKVIESYELLFPTEKIPKERYEWLWDKFGRNLHNLKSFFMLHSDYFLENLFTFDYKILSTYTDNELSSEQLCEIFGQISYNFGELKDYNIEHFILGNPTHEKPFIILSDDTIFSTLWSVMTHFSMNILESLCFRENKLRQKYIDKRASYLENEVTEIFKKAFPTAQIYVGSQWLGDNNKLYENDLLVILGSFAFVVESKAGMVSPSAKRGAPDRLFKTLKELIEVPSEQALRFIDFLKDNPVELSLKVKKSANNKFDASKLKYFIPIGITLSHLGMTSSNLKKIIKAGITDKPIEGLATSMSLTDLEVVFDLLPSTAEKIHYLQRRRELEANVEYEGDELDLLALYLDDGFNMDNYIKKYSSINVTLKSKELDNYIIGNVQNERVTKPILRKSKWWRDILSRLEQERPVNWLEISYILLNVMFNDQVKIKKEFDKVLNNMRKGKAENLHNWLKFETSEEERRFSIFFYGYYDSQFEDRDTVINSILDEATEEDTKGILVIGINVDKNHYPYSVLASTLSPRLFENRYLLH
ncbi:hypothetical protein [Empedobacter brevis]|uniref:hypothetical protein n=1 Tax=Empedobacter brevis TaxID=247 RepID=UPI0028D6D262|nr:hypothetical protein [Empedobacter brevis]